MISLWGIDFHLYGLIIGLAILASLQVSFKYAEEKGIKKSLIEKISWWVIIGGIIGARAYHVTHLWEEFYQLNPISMFFVWRGGLGIWGGIIGGLGGLVAFVKLKNKGEKIKNRLSDLLDVTVIGVPLGQAIGRLGNWVNGELYGKNSEPLFAYEAVLNLMLFGFLWKIRKKEEVAGKISGIYLIGYGLIRILLENLRPEEIIWKWMGVPVAIIVGMISLLIGGIIIGKKRQH